MKHRLVTGSLEGTPEAVKGQAEYIRPVLLCYEGVFQSLDGEVIVTRKKLERIAENYNAHLAKAKLAGNGKAEDKHCAPLQLDHSESATLTVGRMRHNLEVKPHRLLSGAEVMGLFSNATFIGEENCEKGSDGRWANVSIGADFDAGTFTELTITPFPAAPEASLLSRGRPKGDRLMNKFQKCKARLMATKKLSEDEALKHLAKMSDEDMDKLAAEHDEEEKKLSADKDADDKRLQEDKDGEKETEVHIDIDSHKNDDEDEEMKKKRLAAEAEENEKKLAAEKEEEEKRLAAEKEAEEKRLSEEKKDEMAKRLAKKMAEKEPDSDVIEHYKRCAKMSQEEIEDAIKKHEAQYHDLSDGGDKDGEKKLRKLSDEQVKRLARIKKTAGDSDTAARLALKKAQVGARLATLRARAKLTPAEISKINVDELASKNEETINSVFELYENREPVIHTGMLGTMKAMDLSQLSAEIKKVRLKKDEEEHVANMPFLKRARMAAGKGKEKDQETIPAGAIEPNTVEGFEVALAKMADEGKLEDVKRLMGQVLGDVKRLSIGEQNAATEAGKRIKELEVALTEMKKSNEELVELITELTK